MAAVEACVVASPLTVMVDMIVFNIGLYPQKEWTHMDGIVKKLMDLKRLELMGEGR